MGCVEGRQEAKLGFDRHTGGRFSGWRAWLLAAWHTCASSPAATAPITHPATHLAEDVSIAGPQARRSRR